MLFLTIPTAHSHPELLAAIIKDSSLPPEQIILIATRPNLSLPRGCVVIEDLGLPNIQRWWNIGIEEAIKRGATAVAVLNDDLKINSKTLPKLHGELQRTGATIASPTRPDWGPGLYENRNIFPYTPVIWGCLWMLNIDSNLRPDPKYVWWYGDSDLDIKARRDYSGIVTADVYYEHYFPSEGTSSSRSLSEQTKLDAEMFESNYYEFLRASRSSEFRKLFIQTQQYSGRIDDEPPYREYFLNYVCQLGNPARDRVVLVEPNIKLHSFLRELWSGWSNVIIVGKYLIPNSEFPVRLTEIDMYRFASGPYESRQSIARLDVNRFNPRSEVEQIKVPVIVLETLIQEVSPGADLSIFAFDTRVFSIANMVGAHAKPREIIAIHAPSNEKEIRKTAKSLGLYFTGRPWGAAHSSMAFSFKRAKNYRTIKTIAGHAVSTIVDVRKNLCSREFFGELLKVRMKNTGANRLDRNYGIPLSEINRPIVEALILQASGLTNEPKPIETQWQITIESDHEILELNQKCFNTHGVWPLSMSIPHCIEINRNPTEIVSPIMPGYPYSFESEQEYLARYSDAYLALTYRKAGWDCFRHVEIMASGSMPLMPDANIIPEFSMTHYPKRGFSQIVERMKVEGGLPDPSVREGLREFFLSHLTTQKMAAYILASANIPAEASVLFLDENLTTNPEYISTLTAIGLKENLGKNCELLFPGDFLYADSPAATYNFYGRGFGYVKKLDPTLRSPWEDDPNLALINEKLDAHKYDYVVVGSVSRNELLTQLVLERFPRKNVILIHGEDSPPSLSYSQFLRSSGAHIFVRSIN